MAGGALTIEPLTMGERILGWLAFAVLILVLSGCLAILWPRIEAG